MEKAPEYVAVSPMTLWCPRCKAKPEIACDMLDDEVAVIHLERVEAAIPVDQAAKAKEKSPYSVFMDWMANQAENGVRVLTMEEALAAY
jgi:hypothetical protein